MMVFAPLAVYGACMIGVNSVHSDSALYRGAEISMTVQLDSFVIGLIMVIVNAIHAAFRGKK